jgi:hypothetical protein
MEPAEPPDQRVGTDPSAQLCSQYGGPAGLLGVSRVTTVLIIDSDNGLGGP